MIFVQTNDAQANEVLAFRRAGDGTLEPLGATPTGGRGNGSPHLPSQGSLTVAGGHLFVANAGSGEARRWDEVEPHHARGRDRRVGRGGNSHRPRGRDHAARDDAKKIVNTVDVWSRRGRRRFHPARRDCCFEQRLPGKERLEDGRRDLVQRLNGSHRVFHRVGDLLG